MNIFQALILGLVEGLTEYLPVSSTFHLIWAAKFLGLGQSEFQKVFEVVIQSGAIAAVLALYFKDIINDRKLFTKVLVSFVPTATVGLVFYKVIKNFFFGNLFLQLTVFALVGLIFLAVEKSQLSNKLSRSLKEITYSDAFFVGLIQALAVLPGVSRAGAVILSLMYLKVKRQDAAKYSFILAIPTLLAASVFDLIKSRQTLLSDSGNLTLIAVGLITSFVSALVVVKWFVRFLQSHDLRVFGWYRLAAAGLLGLFILFSR
ncbi:undecaprenyl-diphosphate phosphatase [Candidatus Roizmanbacteria bacterium]|nr:undecaprenyl-diphosphate phosphatase [Candidatus Roizmanbacteria bacterium]